MSKVMTHTSQRFVTYHFYLSFGRLDGLPATFVFVDVPGFVARLNWREPSRACVRASANTNEGKKNFAGFDTATRHGTNTLLAAVGLSRVSRSRGSVGL